MSIDDDKKNPLAAYQTVTIEEICDTLRDTQRAVDRIIADKKNPLAKYQTVDTKVICGVLRISRRELDRIIAGDTSFPKELSLPGVRRWLLSDVQAWISLQRQVGNELSHE